MTKSPNQNANAPSQIYVLEEKLENEFKIRLKHGRPISTKDVTPQKRRTQKKKNGAPKEENIEQKPPIEAYGERKAPTDAYGEQKAPIEADIEQETLEEV